MFYLRILFFMSIIGCINCFNVKFGAETENGHWGTKHRISFAFAVGGKHYFFGLTDLTSGRYWFIQELKENGKTGSETSTGTWNNYYTRVFPFAINDKQFIYGIDGYKYWFIQEILPGGIMGTETDNGYWKSKPDIIFPFNVGKKHYVYSLSGRNWFIKELLPSGKLGSETDSGSWNNYYTIGFPFSINGRQYFYCISGTYWFIQELLYGGKMGIETDNGYWTSNHIVNVPFIIDGKHYFYGLTDISSKRYWFIQELLPGGKMGTEKTQGTWRYVYELLFSFNINGRQFLYGVSDYYWFIQEIIQEPRLPIVLATREFFCKNNIVFGYTRPNNNGACSVGCEGINAVEDYVTDIERDDNNYATTTFSNPTYPITSVSTFRVPADAKHASDIYITVGMRGEIHPSHMRLPTDPTISSDVHEHLRQMDRENDDEAGHLLASTLGGPGVPYNFVPHSPTLNRAVNIQGSILPQPGWYDVEELLRDYLTTHGGYIRWTLAPLYEQLSNSRRPTSFALSVQFYNDQRQLVNWRNEGAIRAYVFPNVPTVACTNPNHSWWNF